MADREKVIKALQNCSVQNDVGCQGCPYFEERKTYGHEWCTTSMAQDAFAVLKDQEELLHKKQKDIDRLCVEISKLKYQKHDKRIPFSPDSNVQWT